MPTAIPFMAAAVGCYCGGLRAVSSRRLLVLRRSMSSSEKEVLLEKVNGKGVITLNRPKALNALNLNMIRMIYPILKEWENEVSMVLIRGAGEKAFCAGGDVKSIVEAGKKGDPKAKQFFEEEYKLNSLVGTYHVPYVALVDGVTMGGGVGLSVHGWYRIATERTLFAMPETAIGLFPDVGGGYFLPRLGGHLGTFLALTGVRLRGWDLVKAGIATHAVDSSRREELERRILDLESPETELPNLLAEYTQKARFKNENFSLTPHLVEIERCFSEDSVEGILRKLNDVKTPWALETASTVLKMSPTSLKITLRQQREGATRDIQQCLAMEYRMARRCLEGHDFYEGVRALLVDKDQNPQWKPKTLEEVTDDMVDAYFAPLPEKEELQL